MVSSLTKVLTNAFLSKTPPLKNDNTHWRDTLGILWRFQLECCKT